MLVCIVSGSIVAVYKGIKKIECFLLSVVNEIEESIRLSVIRCMYVNEYY